MTNKFEVGGDYLYDNPIEDQMDADELRERHGYADKNPKAWKQLAAALVVCSVVTSITWSMTL